MPQVRSRNFPLQGGLDLVTSMMDIDPGRAFTMRNFVPWYNGGYRRVPGYEAVEVLPEDALTDFEEAPVRFRLGFQYSNVIDPPAENYPADSHEWLNEGALGAWRLDDTIFAAKRFHYWNSTSVNERNNFNAILAKSEGDTGFSGTKVVYPGVIFFDRGTEHGANLGPGDTILLGENLEPYMKIVRVVLFGGSWSDGTAEGYVVGIVGTTDFSNSAIFSVGWALNAALSNNDDNTQVSDNTDSNNVVFHADSRYYITPPNLVLSFENGSSLPISYIGTTDDQYQFVEHNFYGGSDTKAIYGIGGGSVAFELCKCDFEKFQPDNVATQNAANFYNNPTWGAWYEDIEYIYIPIFLKGQAEQLIDSNFGDDVLFNAPPIHIEAHEGHLFLAFEGGSLQTSILGEPTTFRGDLGSAEFGLGAEITGIKSIPGQVLIITTTDETYGLYGKDAETWDLRKIGDSVGAYNMSLQNLGGTYAMNATGIIQHSRSQDFGDFVSSSLSQLVQPYVQQYDNSNVVCSTVNRESNQYRVYFDDMTALAMYIPDGSLQEEDRAGVRRRTPRAHFGIIEYPVQINQIYNCEDENGKERTYFITDDARHIFEDGVGTSFNGAAIDAQLRLTFANLGSQGIRKRMRNLGLEIHASSPISFTGSYLMDFNEDTQVEFSVDEDSGSHWNISSAEAVWSGQGKFYPTVKLTGWCEAISINLEFSSADDDPFVVQGLNLHFQAGRQVST